MVILSGLISAWYGCNGLVAWCMQRKWFVWLTAFSFIIYAVHAPLIAYTIEALFEVISQTPQNRLLIFICLPLLIIAMAVGTGATLRRLWPGLYRTLTGGRGF